MTILLLVALQTQMTGSLAGIVRDTAGRPIDHAVVLVNNKSHTTVDSLGQYRIDSVPAGAVHLSIRRLGYTKLEVDTVLSTASLHLDIVLHVSTIKLDQLPLH